MHKNIAATLDRADEVYQELMEEYDRSLREQHVSDRAIQLTHEVCERTRSALDRTVRRYWDIHVAPSLTEEDSKKAKVYFPITESQEAFDSMMGKSRWKALRTDNQPIYDYLLSLQPFVDRKANKWLPLIDRLAVHSKHIDLVPQTRTEQRRVTVRGRGGSVSYGPGVTFGPGVQIMGAAVNPATQRIEPTPDVTEAVVNWISFVIDGTGTNAAGFCKKACEKTREVVTEMSDQFGL